MRWVWGMYSLEIYAFCFTSSDTTCAFPLPGKQSRLPHILTLYHSNWQHVVLFSSSHLCRQFHTGTASSLDGQISTQLSTTVLIGTGSVLRSMSLLSPKTAYLLRSQPNRITWQVWQNSGVPSGKSHGWRKLSSLLQK